MSEKKLAAIRFRILKRQWRAAIILAASLVFTLPVLAQSLADAAKANTSKDAKITSKRVFTDDDFPHTASPDSLPAASSTKDPSRNFHEAEVTINRLEDKTERQLGDDIAGDVQFPGRSVWEGKLYAEKQQVTAVARDALAVAKSNASEGVKNSALYKFNGELLKYNDLKSEGIARASDWKKRSEPNVKP